MLMRNIVVSSAMNITAPGSIKLFTKIKTKIKPFGLTSKFSLSRSMIISYPHISQAIVSLTPLLVNLSHFLSIVFQCRID